MQQILYERTIFAPIWQLAFINAPYEDITIKGA
jgi:hypothetical protein